LEVDSSAITDEMIQKYYQMFPEKFVQNPQRQFAYVKFPLTPSSQDSAEALAELRIY
jgi:hypothetical protein